MSIFGLAFIGLLTAVVCTLSLVRPYAGLIGLVLTRGLWDATQFEAIPGVSWWAPLYSESGPIMLPAISLMVATLIFRLVLLPALLTRRARVLDLLGLLLLSALVIGFVQALLRSNDLVKAIKDVAFLGGLLLTLGVGRLSRTRAEQLFVIALCVAACSDLLAFGEALRRMRYYGQDVQAFLLHTYRVIKADHFAPLVTLIGFFLVPPRERSWRRRILLALLIYYGLRFAFNFTRLNWLVLAATIGAYVVLRPTPRNLIRVAAAACIAVVFVIGMYVTNGAVTGRWDLAEQPLVQRLGSINIFDSTTIQRDISIRFRLTESRILLESFASSPLVGTGFGSTISPNDPDEPLRNNISDFFNGYMGLLHKVGLLGTLCILSFLAIVAYYVRYLQRRLPRGYDYAVLNGAYLYCLGIALIIPVSDTLFSNFYSITFSLIVGCALAIGRPAEPAPATQQLETAPCA